MKKKMLELNNIHYSNAWSYLVVIYLPREQLLLLLYKNDKGEFEEHLEPMGIHTAYYRQTLPFPNNMQRESHETQCDKSMSKIKIIKIRCKNIKQIFSLISNFKTKIHTLISYFGFFASLAIIFSNNL